MSAKLGLCWWALQYSCLITELLHDQEYIWFVSLYLTKDMSDFLLVAVLGDQTLHRAKLTLSQLPREAEVALEPSLMLLSFFASRGKTRIWLKPVEELWSQVQAWVLWYHEIGMQSLCRYKIFGCQSAAQASHAGTSYSFQKKELFASLRTENYLTPKNLNCLLFSLLPLGSY